VVAIGERRKPNPNGNPGYLRIDTVHQGDLDKVKGVYYINAVDEVTQMEVVCAVEKISEQYLIPVLEQLIELFPFEIKEIHTDNGSEYINRMVAKLLNKLLIELTKSRARQSNDNALVESKNGSIVRKWLGYCHIPQRHAPIINEFLKNYLVPYINYHRPCHYADIKVDEKTGKQKKTYPYKKMMTPYEKFKSLTEVEQYLKTGITLEELDITANKETDLEAARKVKKARENLFQIITTVA
jgi:transposase InsO family protein